MLTFAGFLFKAFLALFAFFVGLGSVWWKSGVRDGAGFFGLYGQKWLQLV